MMTGGVQRGLVERRGDDDGDRAGERQFHGFRNELVRRFPAGAD